MRGEEKKTRENFVIMDFFFFVSKPSQRKHVGYRPMMGVTSSTLLGLDDLDGSGRWSVGPLYVKPPEPP